VEVQTSASEWSFPAAKRDAVYTGAVRRRFVSLLVGLPLAVVGSWCGTHWVLYWDHVRQFRGVCGPHAPDIPAHPCSYETYVAEFGAGFAGVGLLLAQITVVIVVLQLFAAGWVAACWFVDRRARRAASGGGPREPSG